MVVAHTNLGRAGRVVIPAPFRKALGLNVGDRLVLQLCEGEVRIYSLVEAVRRAEGSLRPPGIEPGRSLVDEFIAERRAEALRE